jgi:hypothetical protein
MGSKRGKEKKRGEIKMASKPNLKEGREGHRCASY